MVKQVVKQEFSPARIALQREVNKHPALCQLLTQYEQDDWGGMLGEIGAFCGVGLEGNYMPHELDKLYDLLYFKLVECRMIIANTEIQ